MTTDPKQYASLDKIWKASGDLANNKTPAVNGDFFSLPVSSSGARSSSPSGPRPAGHDRGQGRVPSQTPSWQTGSSHHPIAMSINDPTVPLIDCTFNFWPLEEQHCAEGFTVSASFKTDDLPLWSGLLSPSARAAALQENRGHCLNCHDNTHSFRNCRHPFNNASSCWNPELGQLGEGDAYKRCQARMNRYRRDGKSSRAQNQKKNRSNRSGQSRRYQRDQGQVNSHSGNPGNSYTSGHHGGVPPSLASSAPAAAPGMRLGAAHNPSGNPNARQPGTFRTDK